MALPKARMLAALDALIQEGAQLHEQFLKDLNTWTIHFVAWEKACESTLEAIYGSQADALQEFKRVYFLPPPTEVYANENEKATGELVWFESGIRYAVVMLTGYRYSIERLLPPDVPQRIRYNVLISHGGPTMTHVNAVSELIETLGLSPVVVSRMPNLNLSLNQKVMAYLSICAAGIALATEEDEVTAIAEKRPRPNVEHEVGLMQSAPSIDGRIIYCKEPGVKFASNYSEKVWIGFEKERVQDAFIPILRELRAFGLL